MRDRDQKKEYRVGLTPDNVKSYVSAGHEVCIQKGAGYGSGFSDGEYEAAGAKVAEGAKTVWGWAETIIKVKEPLKEEYQLFHHGLMLYTYLHIAAQEVLMDTLLDAGVKGIAYETLMEKDGSLPLLTPMSQIAGRLSVQEGAKYLEKPFGGEGILLGGVAGTQRAKVVILGAGTVGANACKIAVGMGADTTIMDVDLVRLNYLDDIFGSRIQTLMSTDGAVKDALVEADLVIGSVLILGKAAPKIIKKEYLKKMKTGSLIVDVAVDQGGCCETTKMTYHDDPVYTVDGVVHYCVGNMPGAVLRTSTIALTNSTIGDGLKIAGNGLEDACRKYPLLYSAVNTYEGKITCWAVAESFGRSYVNPESFIG